MSVTPIVRLMSALAVKAALADTIIPRFRNETGIDVDVEWAPTTLLVEAVSRGQRADAILVMADAMEKLVAEGVVGHDSRTDLAESLVGLAVRRGVPRPDISTTAAFIEALLTAQSIVYSRSGASGLHFLRVIDQLGIADRLAGSLVEIPHGLTAVSVVDGSAEIAIQQISELMQVPGVDIVGPFPGEVESVATLAVAVFTDAGNSAGAMKLVASLASPEAAAIYRAAGLRPVVHPRASLT